MQFEIRRARPEEYAELRRIAQSAKRFWGYSESFMQMWRHHLSLTKEYIAQNPVYCLDCKGEIAGFFGLSGQGSTIELKHLWVDPVYIGQKIGQKLFSYALDISRSMHAEKMTISAEPHAQGFYKRMGAVQVGEEVSEFNGEVLQKLSVFEFNLLKD